MTKNEYIERYGIEAYEEHKLIVKKRNYERYHYDKQYNTKHKESLKKRYNTDSEYRLNKLNSSKNYRLNHIATKYVKDGRIDLIENYELAKADNFKGWDIHHKLEINDDYINTVNDLKLMNLYYERPPEELIWLTKSDHHTLHIKMQNLKK